MDVRRPGRLEVSNLLGGRRHRWNSSDASVFDKQIVSGGARQGCRMLRHDGKINRVNEADRTGEFDPGSERTLAGGLTHASRALPSGRAANG